MKFAKKLKNLDAIEMTNHRKEFQSAIVVRLRKRKSRNKLPRPELQQRLQFSKNQIKMKRENHITKMKNPVKLSVVAAGRESKQIKEALMMPERQIKSNKNHNKSIIEERVNIKMMMKIKMENHLQENKA